MACMILILRRMVFFIKPCKNSVSWPRLFAFPLRLTFWYYNRASVKENLYNPDPSWRGHWSCMCHAMKSPQQDTLVKQTLNSVLNVSLFLRDASFYDTFMAVHGSPNNSSYGALGCSKHTRTLNSSTFSDIVYASVPLFETRPCPSQASKINKNPLTRSATVLQGAGSGVYHR